MQSRPTLLERVVAMYTHVSCNGAGRVALWELLLGTLIDTWNAGNIGCMPRYCWFICHLCFALYGTSLYMQIQTLLQHTNRACQRQCFALHACMHARSCFICMQSACMQWHTCAEMDTACRYGIMGLGAVCHTINPRYFRQHIVLCYCRNHCAPL